MKDKLIRLMAQWGYEVHNINGRFELWAKAIRGYTSSYCVDNNIRDEFDAAERLVGLLHDDNYYNQWQAITYKH